MNKWWWRDGISDANLEMGCENLTADLLAAQEEIDGILVRLQRRIEERERNRSGFDAETERMQVQPRLMAQETQRQEDERLDAWKMRLIRTRLELMAARHAMVEPIPILADEPRANKRERYPHALGPVREGIRAR